MAINPVNTNLATAQTVGETMGVVRLEFTARMGTMREAAILWREAIGQIPSLSSSLVGAKPLCADELSIDLKQHKVLRRFFDCKSLEAFWDYLAGLIEQVRSEGDGLPMPLLARGGYNFCYRTASDRAEITLQFNGPGSGWCVHGWADFVNPRIAQMNLTRKGFKVKGYQMLK